MEARDIIFEVLNMNITQQELGDFLGITRQTVANIVKGNYTKLSNKTKKRLDQINERSEEEVIKILKMNRFFEEIKDRVFIGDHQYIDYAYEGFSYMHYWITNPKFIGQEKYHKYFFGHLNNFYPRFNQIALFMRDTLNRQRYPLITYQIDYKINKIKNFSIKSFVAEHKKEEYDTSSIIFPISFQRFFEELKKRINPSTKFLLYLDYKDDDWKYILSQVPNQWIHEIEIYDLSRLFNFFTNEQMYYGPLIENVLDQYRIPYKFDKLMTDCSYRADKIIELINMNSLEELHQKKYDKSSMMFDSHGLKRDNQYVQNERRKIKEIGKL